MGVSNFFMVLYKKMRQEMSVIGRSPCFGLFLPVSTSEDIIFPFVTKFLPVADISEAVTGGGGCSIKKDVLKNFGKSTGK